MVYFIYDEKEDILIEKIVKGMVNIQTGLRVYDGNGNRLPHPWKPHLFRDLGFCKLTIRPSVGFICVDSKLFPKIMHYALVNSDKLVDFSVNTIAYEYTFNSGLIEMAQTSQREIYMDLGKVAQLPTGKFVWVFVSFDISLLITSAIMKRFDNWPIWLGLIMSTNILPKTQIYFRLPKLIDFRLPENLIIIRTNSYWEDMCLRYLNLEDEPVKPIKFSKGLVAANIYLHSHPGLDFKSMIEATSDMENYAKSYLSELKEESLITGPRCAYSKLPLMDGTYVAINFVFNNTNYHVTVLSVFLDRVLDIFADLKIKKMQCYTYPKKELISSDEKGVLLWMKKMKLTDIECAYVRAFHLAKSCNSNRYSLLYDIVTKKVFITISSFSQYQRYDKDLIYLLEKDVQVVI